MSLLVVALVAIIIFLVLSILWERMPPRMSIRRKLAVVAWEPSTSPCMMGVVTLNAEPALAFLSKVNDEKNNTTGTKVTMTAYTGKVLGLAMAKYPRMNVRLLWGKIFPHETVDVSFLVAIGNDSDSKTPDLAQVKVSQINERSMVEIAKLLGGGARELRSGTNKEYNKTKETVQAIPTFLLKYIVNFAGWLSSAAGVSIPALGVNAFPFGSCIVTSLGPLGVEEALIPPTPFANVPVYMAICATKKVPAVVDDQIVIQTQMKVTGTVDHRIIDGAEVAKFNKYFQQVFEDPDSHFKLAVETSEQLILSKKK